MISVPYAFRRHRLKLLLWPPAGCAWQCLLAAWTLMSPACVQLSKDPWFDASKPGLTAVGGLAGLAGVWRDVWPVLDTSRTTEYRFDGKGSGERRVEIYEDGDFASEYRFPLTYTRTSSGDFQVLAGPRSFVRGGRGYGTPEHWHPAKPLMRLTADGLQDLTSQRIFTPPGSSVFAAKEQMAKQKNADFTEGEDAFMSAVTGMVAGTVAGYAAGSNPAGTQAVLESLAKAGAVAPGLAPAAGSSQGPYYDFQFHAPGGVGWVNLTRISKAEMDQLEKAGKMYTTKTQESIETGGNPIRNLKMSANQETPPYVPYKVR